MREIKCKARTEFSTEELGKLGIKHENGWVYGTYLDGYIVNDVVEATDECISLGNWLAVLKNTVGQCTGLKDKNGKEIYEGDILRGWGTYDLLVNIEGGHVIIKWFDNEPVEDYLTNTYIEDDGLEVVGNIYENPELLEVKQ